MTSVVVRYTELALKGKNRPWFMRRLVHNLHTLLAGLGVHAIRLPMGRVEIVLGPSSDLAEIRRRLGQAFGVANFSIATKVEPDIARITEAILRDLPAGDPASFKVKVRRADKRYPVPSPEVERQIGGRIAVERGWAVNLHDPGLTIGVEILPGEAFYHFGKERGSGGLPSGTAGRVVALLSGGIDSPVAAFRMMRRGCRATFVHFHSYPYLPMTSQEKARRLAAVLTPYQLRSTLVLVPFGDLQRDVTMTVPGALRVLVYRRLMLRIAERIARRARAHALVTGEVVGQVASQTVENLAVTGAAATLPIFRPLIGMDKDEIIDQARRLGTYDISIEPDQDCCTLFTPRHPVTRAIPAEIAGAEATLPIDDLVAHALRHAVAERLEYPGQVIRSSPGQGS